MNRTPSHQASDFGKATIVAGSCADSGHASKPASRLKTAGEIVGLDSIFEVKQRQINIRDAGVLKRIVLAQGYP